MNQRNIRLEDGTNRIIVADPGEKWGIGPFVCHPAGGASFDYPNATASRPLRLTKHEEVLFSSRLHLDGRNELTFIVVVRPDTTLYFVATRHDFLYLKSKDGQGPNGEDIFYLARYDTTPKTQFLAPQDAAQAAAFLGTLGLRPQPNQAPLFQARVVG